MRYITLCVAGLLSVLAVSCQSKPVPSSASSKERAEALAKQLREAMTEPSIMQLDAGRMADSGLRGIRQREVAKPIMQQLIACGKAAEEPLWQLINDDNDSVRRSCVILLGSARTDAEGKPVASQNLLALHIPLLERALTSPDAQVRLFACEGLGDFANWSDECLEGLKFTLPKLRELRNDSDKEVRARGYMACTGILEKLSKGAKTPEERKKAADELEQLQREKKW